MTGFKDLKSQWGNQNKVEIPEDGAKKILEKIALVRKKQQISNVVLGLTAVVLIAFFFYVSAYKFQTVMIGLLMMIGALVLRIGIEILSLRRLKNMNVTTTLEKFKQQMIGYYEKRKKVHFIATPIIILIYCFGFVLLLPAFKESLSVGFYNYIVVSSIVLFVVLSLFIAREVKRELLGLRELQR
jgi:hypothetical protein